MKSISMRTRTSSKRAATSTTGTTCRTKSFIATKRNTTPKPSAERSTSCAATPRLKWWRVREFLTTQQPFYFEGAWAEKIEDHYFLHDGFITDCTIPNPWWTLKGNLFDIIPEDRAIARHSTYHLAKFPLFYFPYFYKSLKKEPRKSGFMTPNFGNSSTRGYMIGAGYYWAISRDLDLTYLGQYFTVRGPAHHLDFRGKPTQKTDFNLIFYGVQDRGYYSGSTLIKDGLHRHRNPANRTRQRLGGARRPQLSSALWPSTSSSVIPSPTPSSPRRTPLFPSKRHSVITTSLRRSHEPRSLRAPPPQFGNHPQAAGVRPAWTGPAD